MSEHLQLFQTGTWTLAKREVVRIMVIWKQSILPSAITTLLYFSIFGVVLGSRVGQIDGVSYIEFVCPGLIMLALVTNSYTNTAFSIFIEKFHRSLEELLSSPLSDHQIIVGFVMGGIFRGMACALVVWLISVLFLGTLMMHPLLFVVTCFLSALFFSLAGVVNGLVASSFDELNVVTTFLLNPLVMLGGVFYSVTMLPGIWQHIAWLNPLLYVGNLFRFAIIGTSNIRPLLVILVLIVLSCFAYGLSFWLLKYSRYVRK